MDKNQIYEKVQRAYSAAVKGNGSDYGRKVAVAFGYSEQELASIPDGANLGLSCGNPLSLAKLREGEIVIDLGSGAGFDVFLAAKKVGAHGRAIGVDMNKDMLERAERNKERVQSNNASFVESRITKVALPDAIADCIISNCVVNLVPEEEKQLVFNEMFRLLKTGGRVAISDILMRKELSQELKRDVALYVGCIAGASEVKQYEDYLHTAGFDDIRIVDAHNDLNVYKSKGAETSSQCCGTDAKSPCREKSSPGCDNQGSEQNDAFEASRNDFAALDFNEWAGSFKIYAIKA
ncbi:hypothetical protein PV08_10446 [Exophiala spinifera]|uniref:Arsenite methyltransferase n=1 Tax=Exophiala spinifera TaxID=91928 RepID=A0A0D1Y848_9EURO|nr:uncharacterized protein PV08_10446 [Exophiala spinifera]KIW11146.1 hypothetical protein PV08_10446 [Exophiala spinifera]